MYNKNSIIKRVYSHNYYWVNETHNNEKRSNTDNNLENNNSESTYNQDINIISTTTRSVTIHRSSTSTKTISTLTNTIIQTLDGNSEPTPSTNPLNNDVSNADTSLDNTNEGNVILSSTINNTYENENLNNGAIIGSTNTSDTPNISNVSSVDKNISENQGSNNITSKVCIAIALCSILIICIIYFVNERLFRSKNTKKNNKNIKEVMDTYQDVSKENFHNFSLIAYQNLSTMKGNTSRHSTYNYLLNTSSNNSNTPKNMYSSHQDMYSSAGSPLKEHVEIPIIISNDIPQAVMNTYSNIIDSKNLPNETMNISYNDNDISKSVMDTYQGIIINT